MKFILPLTFLIFLSAATGTVRSQSAPEWSISNIQLSFLKSIGGTNNTTVADKGSIVELRGKLSNLGDPAAGQHIPLPVMKLSGTNGAASWTVVPIAIGFDSPISCSPYYFLDSARPSSSPIGSLQSLGIDIVDGNVRVTSGSAASLCFAFSVPFVSPEMVLEFSGTRRVLDSSAVVNKPVVVIPSLTAVALSGVRSAPTCNPVEPSYTDAARQAHIQGQVTLSVIIHLDGSVTVNRVVQGLGYGLDEEAANVMTKWKCTPGKVNGQPVNMQIQIVVKFHLY